MPARRLRLSHRLPWDAPWNRLARAVAERAARGLETIDLTLSNPTRADLPYPVAELAEILGRAALPDYPPHPLGLPEAREALAAALSLPEDPVTPADLVLTASTSESYSHLFKLFADPGREVLTAVPSYPLLDSLTALDGLVLRHFPLEPGRRFALDPGELERALSSRTRLLVLVHPGNPTGAFLSAAEQDAVARLCAERRLPLVSDEVFADYPLTGSEAGIGRHAGPAAARADILSFSLGGLSKSAGLPSWKLGWIRVGGPAAERRRAIAALELIADTYLSVATPVQRALPDLLALAPRIRAAILERLRDNLKSLRAALAGLPAVELIEPHAGWSAVVRVPRLRADEDLAVDLLNDAGVLVHPGHLFDFAAEGYLVLSLLPQPSLFAHGLDRLAGHLGATISGGAAPPATSSPPPSPPRR
ncbi:MAG: pyridoxal phosphate-dependent aminotransferase [Acidobacteriota bacterium]|nr:pyridoxal phosphate-dependent aminotransferase [Acidobacteriota bacterium]